MKMLIIRGRNNLSSNDRSYELSEILYKMSTDELKTSNTTYNKFTVSSAIIDGENVFGLLCNPDDVITFKDVNATYLKRLVQIIFDDFTDEQAQHLSMSLLTHRKDDQGNDMPLTYTMQDIAGLGNAEWVDIENE